MTAAENSTLTLHGIGVSPGRVGGPVAQMAPGIEEPAVANLPAGADGGARRGHRGASKSLGRPLVGVGGALGGRKVHTHQPAGAWRGPRDGPRQRGDGTRAPHLYVLGGLRAGCGRLDRGYARRAILRAGARERRRRSRGLPGRRRRSVLVSAAVLARRGGTHVRARRLHARRRSLRHRRGRGQ